MSLSITNAACGTNGRGIIRASVLSAALLMGSAVAHATIDLTFTSTATNYTNIDGSGVTMDLSPWHDGNDSTISQTNAVLEIFGGGLGIDDGAGDPRGETTSNGEHAIDNLGEKEFLVLEFDHAVSITGYTFGWWSDYDSTLLYWNGGAFSTASDVAGKTIAGDNSTAGSLAEAGWKTAGHYFNNSPEASGANNYTNISGGKSLDTTSGNSTLTAGNITDGIYSKVWILGAYMQSNPDIPSGAETWGGNDKFKFKTLSFVKQPLNGDVPVPAPLALIALGLIILRKRKAQ